MTTTIVDRVLVKSAEVYENGQAEVVLRDGTRVDITKEMLDLLRNATRQRKQLREDGMVKVI